MVYEFGMPIFGWMFWMGILGTLLWIVFLGLIIWFIIKLVRQDERKALEIAKERLAKGEITKEEYEEIKEELR